MPRRDFRRPQRHTSRSRFRRAVRRLRSRSENPAVTLQAKTVSSAAETDLPPVHATFIASDRVTVCDRKFPPEFFKRETCNRRARVFSHIKPSGPNRKPGISAYIPGRAFTAFRCIRRFGRTCIRRTSHGRFPLKVPPGLFRLFTVSVSFPFCANPFPRMYAC